MKLFKKEWLQLLILAVPFCAAALLGSKLPETMPVHWDTAGRANGFASRGFAIYFLPCMNIAMAILLGCLPLLDSRVRACDAEGRGNMWHVARTIRLGLTAFMSAVALAILAAGMHLPLNMTMVTTIGSALLFVILGNVLAKVRPNSFIGIRTPWTLDSKEVWTKTHRLAGKVMVGGGLLLIPLSLLMPSQQYIYFVFVPLTLVIVMISAVYSYWYSRQLKRS